MTVAFNQDGFAETSGEIIVYCTDNQGIYSHSATEYVSAGGSLSAGSYLDAPPQPKQGFVIVRADNSWKYQVDRRGTYYSKETGEKVEHTALGELPENLTELAPLAEPCKWNGTEWVISKEKQAELIVNQRAEIRAQINAKRDECVNGGAFVPEINKWVDTDDKGRSTLVEIKADFDLNGKNNTYTLICADNTAQVIHFEEFKAVWNAVKTLKEKMYENAYMHKVLLEQSENPTDYNWSTGWSKTYQEHLNEQQA